MFRSPKSLLRPNVVPSGIGVFVFSPSVASIQMYILRDRRT